MTLCLKTEQDGSGSSDVFPPRRGPGSFSLSCRQRLCLAASPGHLGSACTQQDRGVISAPRARSRSLARAQQLLRDGTGSGATTKGHLSCYPGCKSPHRGTKSILRMAERKGWGSLCPIPTLDAWQQLLWCPKGLSCNVPFIHAAPIQLLITNKVHLPIYFSEQAAPFWHHQPRTTAWGQPGWMSTSPSFHCCGAGARAAKGVLWPGSSEGAGG